MELGAELLSVWTEEFYVESQISIVLDKEGLITFDILF